MGEYSPSQTVVDDSNAYIPGYFELAQLCAKHDLALVLCRGKRLENGMAFEQNCRFQPNMEVEWLEQPVQLDALYVKNRRFSEYHRTGDLAFNDPAFTRTTDDKWEIYKLFPHLCAKTIFLESNPTPEQLDELQTERIVLKPLSDSGGKGIYIVAKDADITALNLKYPYLAQEFLDTSSGIPGICEGRHDLRLITSHGELVTAYFRRPPEGGMLANISLGGSAQDLVNEQVPADAVAIMKEVDAHFTNFPQRMYSVDILYANGKPYLCELNDKPGFPLVEQTQYYKDRFNQAILDNFLEILGM